MKWYNDTWIWTLGADDIFEHIFLNMLNLNLSLIQLFLSGNLIDNVMFEMWVIPQKITS